MAATARKSLESTSPPDVDGYDDGDAIVRERDEMPEPGDPTAGEIAERAYAFYEARGGQDGYDVDDWLAAERELRESRAGIR